jgi:hypothetical protein
VFVEPGNDGKIITKQIRFEQKETKRVQELLLAMWQHVMALDMPVTSAYGDSLKDIHAFEQKLLEETRGVAAGTICE